MGFQNGGVPNLIICTFPANSYCLHPYSRLSVDSSASLIFYHGEWGSVCLVGSRIADHEIGDGEFLQVCWLSQN